MIDILLSNDPQKPADFGKLCKSYCAAHLLCRVLARRSPIYLIGLATRSAASRILGLLATLLQSFL